MVAADLIAAVTQAETVALAFVLAGWWWGSARLDAIDRSPLTSQARVVVTAPPRRSSFAVRIQAQLQRFGDLAVSEPILLELPAGRAPAQGAVLDVLGVLAPPHGPENGFDERTWLRRTVIAVCSVIPFLVAYARLYRGMHHLSDVVVGAINGLICAGLAAHCLGRRRRDTTEATD